MSNNDQFDDLDDFEDFDEVADDPDPVSESAADDDDWDQYDDSKGDSAANSQDRAEKKNPGKKKSGLLGVLLIGGVVLAGGGFLFLQTGGKSAPVPLEQQELQEDTTVAELQEPPAVPPMPSPIMQLEAAMEGTPAPEAARAPTPAQRPVEGQDAALRMPKAEDILLKSAPDSAPAIAEKPAQVPIFGQSAPTGEEGPAMPAVPAAVVAPAPAGLEISLMIEKLDVLSTRLEALETKLEAYREEKSDAGAASAAIAEQFKALQQSVASLERRLNEKQAAPVQNRAAPENDFVPSPAPAKPRPQILGQSIDTVPVPVPEETGSVPAMPAPAVPLSSGWVLKGAQPGRAMVARKGENDLHPVEVGDTLPGIGRITTIIYQNGKWEVNGTQGSISQ